MPKIFISYRRSDSEDVTGRIYDRLVANFGKDAIFKDVDDIPFGVDFRDYLNKSLDQCQVVLAVIGKTWLSAADVSGKCRLDNPADWVRLELEEALKRKDVLVVPLLVSRASLPRADELPQSLVDMTYRNWAQARPDPDFHKDMDRLVDQLEKHFTTHAESPTLTTETLSTSTPLQKDPSRQLALESKADRQGIIEKTIAKLPVETNNSAQHKEIQIKYAITRQDKSYDTGLQESPTLKLEGNKVYKNSFCETYFIWKSSWFYLEVWVDRKLVTKYNSASIPDPVFCLTPQFKCDVYFELSGEIEGASLLVIIGPQGSHDNKLKYDITI